MVKKEFVCITGVSTGIGRALLDYYVRSGYHVIGSVRKVEDAREILKQYPEYVSIMVFDVRNQEQTESAMMATFNSEGVTALKVLINNAGVAMPGPLQYLSEEEFEMQLDVNVKAVRRITNFCLPYLGVNKESKSEKPGMIIMISSVSGMFNSPYNGAYCISKHALESMTDVYRRELHAFGIKVISVQPGPVKTAIWKKSINTLNKYHDTEYGHIMQKANTLIENTENSAMDVSKVVHVVDQIMRTKNPDTRYLLHKKKLMFRILSSYLPDKWADKLVFRALASGDKYRPV